MRKLGYLGFLSLLACGPQPVSLELSPRPLPALVSKGEQQTLQLRAFDLKNREIENPAVAWFSSNPEVASVENGVVTAHRSGSTVITAKTGKAQAMVDAVVALPTSLEVVQGKSLMVARGQSTWLTGLVRNEKGAPIRDVVIEWESEDPTVAIVESSRVKGISPGRVTLTARHRHLVASAEIRVLESELSYLELQPTRLNFDNLGQTKALHARMLDSKGHPVSDVPFLWFTSNPKVASVDDSGHVTSHSAGMALITVTFGRFKGGSDVLVTPPLPRK